MFKAFVFLQNHSAVNHPVSHAWNLLQERTARKHGLGIRNDGNCFGATMQNEELRGFFAFQPTLNPIPVN